MSVIDEQVQQQRDSRQQARHCEDPRQRQKAPTLADIDLCEIVKRSEDEHSKHNDYECHIKGEKRQNLLNKIKMFLDDYDERPVMKKKGKGGDEGKAVGQTGFGPLIKYPGYVDYDHPYFSDPYNKMPALAMTVGQRGENPCPPIQVRNWDECYQQNKSNQDGSNVESGGKRVFRDNKCHCADRSGEVAMCHAAIQRSETHSGGVNGHGAYQNPCQANFTAPSHQRGIGQSMPQHSHNSEGCMYYCIPLPDDC